MARLPAHVFMFVVVRLSPLSLLILIWLLPATASAQYRFDSWTTDNGLPQNTVHSIIQTRDGYLWLTTFDGLVRFDGVRFTVFDKSNTKGLITNRFTSLYEDKDGALLAGTGDGGLTLYRNGVFTSYANPDGIATGEVMGFDRDLKGELLMRTRRGQFYLRDGKFVTAPAEYQAADTRLYLAPSGSQWTLSKNGITQSSGNSVIRYPLKLSFGPWVWLLEDSQRNLWLGDRLALYRLHDGQITRFTKETGAPPNTALLPACEDSEGGVWFATGSSSGSIGLVRFKDGQFHLYGTNSGLNGP